MKQTAYRTGIDMQNALLLVKQMEACNLAQFWDKSGSIWDTGRQGPILGLSLHSYISRTVGNPSCSPQHK